MWRAVGADHRAFLDATIPYLDVARQAAGDGQDPEDLMQEAYLRAYAGFGSYRGGNARAWLAAICLNVARARAPPAAPVGGVTGSRLLDVLPLSRRRQGGRGGGGDGTR